MHISHRFEGSEHKIGEIIAHKTPSRPFKIHLSHLHVLRFFNGSRFRLLRGSTLHFLVGRRRLGGIQIELFIEVLSSQDLLRWRSLPWCTVLCGPCWCALSGLVADWAWSTKCARCRLVEGSRIWMSMRTNLGDDAFGTASLNLAASEGFCTRSRRECAPPDGFEPPRGPVGVFSNLIESSWPVAQKGCISNLFISDFVRERNEPFASCRSNFFFAAMASPIVE